MGENRHEKEKDKHKPEYSINLKPDLAEMDNSF